MLGIGVFAAPFGRGRNTEGSRFRIPTDVLYSSAVLHDLRESGLVTDQGKGGMEECESRYVACNWRCIAVLGVRFHSFLQTPEPNMLRLPFSGERAQRQFWREVWPGTELLAQMEIVEVFKLPEPVAIRAQTEEMDGAPRNLLFCMTHPSTAKVQKLMETTGALEQWKVKFPDLPGPSMVDRVAIRVPLPHALLLKQGAWTSYTVPCICQSHRRVGLSVLQAAWPSVLNQIRTRRRQRARCSGAEAGVSHLPPLKDGTDKVSKKHTS